MSAQAVKLLEQEKPHAAPVKSTLAEARCGPEAMALVLSEILERPLSPEEVWHKAVGLGLVRGLGEGESPGLTAQAASRLLLAGYGIPGHVEPGTVDALGIHWQRHRHVFVLLDSGEEGSRVEQLRPAVLRVDGTVREEPTLLCPLLTVPSASLTPGGQTPLELFLAAWAAAGNRLIVAARQWADLPTQGSAFFGGSREPNGVYHWDVAECDTDRDGRILRY
jgi:hypothetical protein